MKKQKENKQKGITLIALIITIIVMLILVGVSVSVALNGGLFKTAKQAAKQTKAAVQEESGLKYEYEIAKATRDYTGTYKEYVLQKEYEEKKASGEIAESETFEEYAINKYSLGAPINTENYGKVVNYKSKGEGLDSLKWRVFYQDNKNTYLISETDDGKLPVTGLTYYTESDDNTLTKKDIVKKYKSGADVSIYGQALMPKASDLFTESNEYPNIIATAYLCDPEVWDEYTDAEGKAIYAIGSPTIELFSESYNALNPGNLITLSVNGIGYSATNKEHFENYQFNLGLSFRLSSPGFDSGAPDLYKYKYTSNCEYLTMTPTVGDLAYALVFNKPEEGLRPVVCIPTTEFSYELSD